MNWRCKKKKKISTSVITSLITTEEAITTELEEAITIQRTLPLCMQLHLTVVARRGNWDNGDWVMIVLMKLEAKLE